MKVVSKDFIKEIISKTVITVPVYFNVAQKQTTRDARNIVSLDILRIIKEKTNNQHQLR